jgi:hypothetical protein
VATEMTVDSIVDQDLSAAASVAVDRFCGWLKSFGETSYDFQTVYASPLGRAAKALYYRQRILGTMAVAPMVFCEAFAPRARRLFWKPQRFPIADAHYAMAFAFLAGSRREEKWLDRAHHFLSVLEATRCPGMKDYGWGYPFDWETMYGTVLAGTPLITTTPYVYEAFSQVYALDRDPRWLAIMESIARHAFADYRSLETGFEAASSAYTPSPTDPCLVVNASAYRAFLLAKAGIELAQPQYVEAAKRNIRFVASAQNADGSWPYAMDGRRGFVDHFHTCFVLKSLAKAAQLIDSAEAEQAIERGVQYYLGHLFDDRGLPRPFARPPRLITYRRELYDYAECVNLAVLLRERFPAFDQTLVRVVGDLIERWQRPDGSFRSRQLLVGWDQVPMHRWAQAQLFRSLCFLLANGMSSQEWKPRERTKRDVWDLRTV